MDSTSTVGYESEPAPVNLNLYWYVGDEFRASACGWTIGDNDRRICRDLRQITLWGVENSGDPFT